MGITVLDAPTNLGLRAPAPGTVPGCYKLPWALRDRGLLRRLDGTDAGAVVPGRYDLGGWAPGGGCFNAGAIADYSLALADRVESLVAEGFLLVLGGECSLTLGVTLGLRRLGRYGLVYLDAHTDHRHPGNAGTVGPVGAAGGEALALVTGLGQADLTDLQGLRPYVRAQDAVLAGLHESPDDSHPEVRDRLGLVLDVPQLRELRMEAAAAQLLSRFEAEVEGVWVHLDADVLDPSVMPAVDSPEPDGLLPGELVDLLSGLLASGRVVGLDVGIYDPDRDPDPGSAGGGAEVLVAVLEGALVRRSITPGGPTSPDGPAASSP